MFMRPYKSKSENLQKLCGITHMKWNLKKLFKNKFAGILPFFLFIIAVTTGYGTHGNLRNVSNPASKNPSTQRLVYRRNREESADSVADEFLTRAAMEEPEITSILASLENEDVRLDGLEYRLKSKDSLTRKILKRSQEQNTGIRDAAAGISDVLRYTYVTSDDKYSETVTRALRKLSRAGIETAVYKSIWGQNAFVYDWNGKYRSAPDPNQYQGTNVVLYTPGDIPVEIQFHTEASFRTKQNTHRFYEVIRSRDCSPEEKAEAIRQQAILNAEIPVPEGARELRYPV